MKKNLFILFIVVFSFGCGMQDEPKADTTKLTNSETSQPQTPTNPPQMQYIETPDFSKLGYILFRIEGKNIYPHDIAISSNGKLFVIGTVEADYKYNTIIICFNIDGTIDKSFNDKGYLIENKFHRRYSYDRYNIHIDNENKLLVVGAVTEIENGEPISKIIILKYTLAGVLDLSFNNKGYILHDSISIADKYDDFTDSIIDETGKIIVTGSTKGVDGYHKMSIWRFNSDGSLDSTFNNQGYMVVNEGYEVGTAGRSITLGCNNEIFITGYSANGFSIWSFNSDGSKNEKFAGGSVSFGGSTGGGGFSIKTDSKCRIIVVGTKSEYNGSWGPFYESNDSLIIKRFYSDGTYDGTLNQTGYIEDKSSEQTSGRYVYLTESKKIIVLGRTNSQVTIWKYNELGELDESFNRKGYMSRSSFAGGAKDYGIKMLSTNGSYYALGSSVNAHENREVLIWKINNL